MAKEKTDSLADTVLEGATEPSDFRDVPLASFSDRITRHELIGEGGLGQVHLADQESLDRKVAVKSVQPAVSSNQAQAILMREARIMAQLDHPSIVPIYDLRVIDGEPCVLMKQVVGKTLDQCIQQESPGMPERLRVFGRVCEAVSFAHHKGILHLDLKPNNILLGEFGEVYVADWGMAREIATSDKAPLSGGTPNYMAPEMVDDHNLGIHTDIYLLGGLLYYLLEERAPHRASSSTELLALIARSEMLFQKSSDSMLQQICSKATSAKPESRHGTVGELRRAIDGLGEYRVAETMTLKAEAIRVDLQNHKDPSDWQAQFVEARTLLEQALALTQDFPKTGHGMTQLLKDAIDYQISHGNFQIAASIAESSSWVSAESLRAAKSALEDHRARLREQEAQLEQLSAPKARKLIASLGTFLLIFVVIPQIPRLWFSEPIELVATIVIGLEAVVWGLGVAKYRDKLRENRFVRYLFSCLALIMVSSGIAVASASLLGHSQEQAMLYAIFGNGFVLATFAVLFDARLLIAAVIYFVLSMVSIVDKSSVGVFAAIGRDVALVGASVLLLRLAVRHDESSAVDNSDA